MTSTTTGVGIDELRSKLSGGGTLALIGASGHGKSSLTNALVGADRLLTKQIRDDGKGRHTSVRRELVAPTWWRSDHRHPWTAKRRAARVATEVMEAAFPEIAQLADGCRFKDCTHTEEAGLRGSGGGRLPVLFPYVDWRVGGRCRPNASDGARTEIRMRHQERKTAKVKTQAQARPDKKGQP